MNAEHVLSEDLWYEAQSAFSFSRFWIAYNTIPYFLEKGEMYFFNNKDSAREFSENNISEHDDYKVIHARSLDELLKQIPYGESFHQKFNLKLFKNNFMNPENFEYLKNNLKYAGFGDKLYPELEQKIQEGLSEFTLKTETAFNKQKMESTLHFRKSDSTDMYFFNKHDAYLKHGADPTKDVQQSFYMNRGQGITLKEAFNLLEGRAVNTDLINKEGQKYNAWVQIDFTEKETNGNFKMKQFHQNYGYDLSATLEKYPIKELMEQEQKEKLMASLQKGNVQSVTITMNGKEEKMFISANPQFKTINVFDSQMKAVQKESLRQIYSTELGKAQEGKQSKAEELGTGNKQDQKKSLKQNGDSDDASQGEAPKKRKRMRPSH